jgi:hypothetical protein
MTAGDSMAMAAIVIGAPVGLFVLHAALSRIVRFCGYGSVAPQIVAVGAAGIGNIPVAYLAWTVVLKNIAGGPMEVLCGYTYVLLTYNACCYGYFNILNLSETSLHVNILMRLLVGGGTRPEELARIYGVDEMISSRIDRMIALGQLKEKDGRYILGNRTLVLVGGVINAWRRLLGLPLSPE